MTVCSHSADVRAVLFFPIGWACHLQVSQGCKDLLARLLVPDSRQRSSLNGIKEHPWFCHALLPHTLEMHNWSMGQGPKTVMR